MRVLAAALATMFVCACSAPVIPLQLVKRAHPTAAPSGDCAFLTPDAVPRSGDTGRCGLTLGAGLLLADCVAGTGLATVKEERYDVSLDDPSSTGPVPRDGQGCHLAARGDGTADRVGSDLRLPADLVVIADFQPQTATVHLIRVEFRCTDRCLVFDVLNESELDFADGQSGSQPVKIISGAAVDVSETQVNRLVVTASGSAAEAWLDGHDLGTVQTQQAGPGRAFFAIHGQSSAGPAAVRLLSFQVFQRG